MFHVIGCCGKEKSAAVPAAVNNYRDSKHHTKHLWYYCIIRILHPLGQCAAAQCSHYLGMFVVSQAQRPLNQERMPRMWLDSQER